MFLAFRHSEKPVTVHECAARWPQGISPVIVSTHVIAKAIAENIAAAIRAAPTQITIFDDMSRKEKPEVPRVSRPQYTIHRPSQNDGTMIPRKVTKDG